MPERAIELSSTPFFPQEEHACGPAALATVLGASGVAVQPAELWSQVYLPGREGSLQLELIAAARRRGRLPYLLGPAVQTLNSALREGYPILLLQNLGFARWPRWHYAVLIGYEPATDEWLLRSGREARQRMSSLEFLHSWDLAGRWALVLSPTDAVPGFAAAESWVEAAAAFEALGQNQAARSAYEAAARRWPERALPWLALANLDYGRHQLPEAEAALREALAREPDVAVRNNLAQVLLERGCPRAAAAQLDALGGVPAPFAAAVADTRRAILQFSGPESADCTTPAS